VLKDRLTRILQKEKITIPLLILTLILLGYGLLTPWMGFYWDDLPFAWFLRFFGPVEFIEAFRPFRPLLGPIFTVTTSLFGGHPFTWQVIGLLTRLLLSLQVWHLLRWTFPTQKANALWVALLFAMYPGYKQQWVALTHVNQEFIPLLFLLSSFLITIWIIRNGRHAKLLTALAILLQALGLFSTEYFFGLEILRFLFLLVIFSQTLGNRKEILQKAIRTWLPYFITWVLNAVWTYAYHRSTAYASYEVSILSSSTLSPLALVNEFLGTLSLAAFISWIDAFDIFAIIDGTITEAFAFGVLLVSAGLVFFTVRAQVRDKESDKNAMEDSWGWQAAGIGLVGIVAGRLPSWAAGLPLKLEFDHDRFFVSIMLGASLFIVGLASLVLREGRRKSVILSLLIGLCVSHQFSTANTFRRDWANQQNLFWELAWRMPAIEENTALLTYELPIQYASDWQMTAGLNWAYAPSLNDRNLPYFLLYLKTRLNSSLPSLQANTLIDIQYRTVHFDGNTSNSLVIYKEAGECLRVLDPVYGNAETVPNASPLLISAIRLSDPSRIIADASEPALDKTLFGAEPSRGWCYTYSKAELARQQGDWERIARLYRQAEREGLNPSAPAEYLPFIEGFALTGDIDMALKLTGRTIKENRALCPALHTLWERVSLEQGSSANVESLLREECKQ
jgi:hypothetical protein